MTSARLKPFFSIVFVLLITLSFACGDDNETTSANNNDANDNNATTPSTDDTTPSTPGVDDITDVILSSYDLIFTKFQFTSGSPGQGLNFTIRNSFDPDLNYPIIVLVELKDIDVEQGTFQIRGGSGLKTDTEGEYIWDPEMAAQDFVEGSIDAQGNIDVVLPLLDFVATVEMETAVEKAVIKIRDLHMQAQLNVSEDGSEVTILDGDLNGHVTKADGDSAKIALTPGSEGMSVTQIFGVQNLNLDTTGDGDEDSWALKATFDAAQTVIID